ncbi:MULTISPECIES: hypothetical protein [unclassified Nocardia]|uniref:hypothetical protein n=1 Tax=unclassified Nocardia TaxID=2637762 RepID=UPI001CE40B4F|nr:MULTISPECIES: hypothetical protein [unclassified Nocardia]
MMVDRLHTYTDKLSTAADANDEVKQKISTIFSRLQANLDGRGEPWGADHYGQGFMEGKNGYAKMRDATFTNAGNLGNGFGTFADGQRTAARKLTRNDYFGA